MKRRIISLMIAMLLILGMPMQALAATHEVSDYDGVYNAFATDTDSEVTVNLTNDITWQGEVTANEGQTYTVNANGNQISGSVGVNGGGSVTVNADSVEGVRAMNGADVTVEANISGDKGIYVDGGSATVNGDVTVTGDTYVQVYNGEMEVNGDITTSSGIDVGNANVEINGDVDAMMFHVNNGDLTVDGNVTTEEGVSAVDGTMTITGNVDANKFNAIFAQNTTVDVAGNVSSANGTGIYAGDNSSITVGGSVSGAGAITEQDENGEYVSSYYDSIQANDSTVTVKGDVNEYLYAYNSSVTVEGNAVDGVITAVSGSTVSVEGNVTGGYDIAPYGGEVYAYGSTVAVKGDVTGVGVSAYENGTVTIDGNIDAGHYGVNSGNNSTVTVGGNVTSKDASGVYATGNSTVTVKGDVTGGIDPSGYGMAGVFAHESTVTVNGNVTAPDLTGSVMDDVYIEPAVGAVDANIYVGGNVKGGDVTVEKETSSSGMPNFGGTGVHAQGSSTVTVMGNVTGGNASGTDSIGGSAVSSYGSPDEPFTGFIKVGGTVTAGKGEGMNGYDSEYIPLNPPKAPVADTPVAVPVEKAEEPVEISIIGTAGTEEAEVALTVTVSEDAKEVVIAEMKEEEIETLLETLKETVKEDSEGTVSIDVSVLKEATSVRIPVKALKAIIETFGKLEIVFNGGTIIIDAEMLEELIDELGFFTISLK